MKVRATWSLLGLAVCGACSSDPAANPGSAGSGGGGAAQAGTGGSAGAAGGGAGAAGAAAGGAGGVGGVGGEGSAVGGGGASSTGGAGGTTGGGAGGTGGASGGGSGGSGTGGSVNHVPGDYKGVAYKALQIPGTIIAADYDRGGAGVAWCHDVGNCSANRVTGDYPANTGPYRTPQPANAQICGGAACDDNVGVCHMNPSKPDNTIDGKPMPSELTYLCYSVAGEWTKYTVTVTEAGTYSVGGVMAVPQNGSVNLSFGDGITTGDIPLAITSTEHSGSGENYHSWDDRKNLGMVTFPTAGKYVMTLTQVGRFNASSFSFTKM